MTEASLPATRTPLQEIVARVRTDDFKQQIQLALPGNVTPERFGRATVTALLQNPDITKADPDSIFQSVIRCAQDGLLPDGKEAALVLFGRKAVYMPMIGGFRKIAAEHGWAIRTQVVYQEDEFEYELGLTPALTHKPVRPGAERGPAVAAYAIGIHRDGRKEIEVLTAEEIEKVRAVSRASGSGPWKDWTERMWEKTVGRRLFAELPLGERDADLIARVLQASDYTPYEAISGLYGAGAAEGLGLQAPARELDVIDLDANGWRELDEPESSGDLTVESAEEAHGQSEVVADPPEPPAGEDLPVQTPTSPAVSSVDPRLLEKAKKMKPPIGTYQDKTLEWLLAQSDADDSIRFLMAKYTPENPFGRLLWALVESERPDLLVSE